MRHQGALYPPAVMREHVPALYKSCVLSQHRLLAFLREPSYGVEPAAGQGPGGEVLWRREVAEERTDRSRALGKAEIAELLSRWHETLGSRARTTHDDTIEEADTNKMEEVD